MTPAISGRPEGAFRWIGCGLAAGILGAFIAVATGEARLANWSGWQDTEGYLGHALYLREHGGLAGFLREAFAGTFPIVERHPLYPLLLAPWASRTAEFFWSAKLINVGLGALVIGSLLWMVWRRAGPAPAVLAASFYAFSRSSVVASAHVNCEVLLTLCLLWAWWLAAGDRRWRWGLAGALLGLGYLTKMSAAILLMALGAAWVCRLRSRQPVGWQALAVLVVVVTAVASPLVMRNIRRYGTPLYGGINSHSMWFDRWRDVANPASIVREDRYGILVLERDRMPTATTYFQTHWRGEIARRVWRGLRREAGLLADAVAPASVRPGFWTSGWSLFVIGLAGLGWWASRRDWASQIFAWWFAGSFAVFAWYSQVVPDIRFLAPLIPVVAVYAGEALWRWCARVPAPRRAGGSVAVAGFAVIVALAGTASAGGFARGLERLAADPAYARIRDWMDHELAEGSTVLLGPARRFHGLWWTLTAPVSRVPAPQASSLADFLQYLAERRVTHLVVHEENTRDLRGPLAEALAPYWDVTNDGGIQERSPLPGWRLADADPSTVPQFLVYRPITLEAATP